MSNNPPVSSGSTPQNAGPEHPFAQAEQQRRKSRNRVIWISAIVLVLLFTVAMVWNVTTQMRDQKDAQTGPVDQSELEPGGADEAAAAGPFTDIEWPKNMATGGMVFTGKDGKATIVESEALPAGTPGPVVNRSSEDSIVIYADYRCPVCNLFEQTNGELLDQLAKAGGVNVEIRPLTFLDQASAGSYYSSRTSAAMACIVSKQPEAAWDAHTSLLSEFQPEEGTTGHDNAAIIKHLDKATGGLNEDVQQCIADESNVPFAQAANTWALSNPVPDAQDQNTQVTGTPFVLVNGVQFTGDIQDPKPFADFVKQQGIKLP